MKKSLVFLLVVVLGIFLLTGCLTKEKVEEMVSLKTAVENFKAGDTKVIKSEGIVIDFYGKDASDNSSGYSKVYVQDEDGEVGVVLYQKNDTLKNTVKLGDLIEFEGTMEAYKGEISVTVDKYEIKEHGKVVNPNLLTSSMLQKITIDGTETTTNMVLVTVDGTVVSSDYTITLETEDINEITVYLPGGFKNTGVGEGDRIKIKSGVLKLYNWDWEIALRSADDYEILEEAPEEEPEINYSGLAKIKNEIVNGTTEFTGIEGIVVYQSGSVAVINDATTGIYIKEGMDTVSIGDKIVFDATGYKDTYHGNIKLKAPKNINIESSNNDITTFDLSVDINTKTEWKDLVEWDYKLVKVKGSLLPNDDYTYKFEYTLDDGTPANVLVYSKAMLETAYGGTIPTSTEATVTGYLAKYKGTWQIYLRDENDVEF